MQTDVVRVLLDSNVWRYAVEAGAVDEFRKEARAAGLAILVAPTVLYEAAATRNQSLRRQLVEALTRRVWVRLMSDAYLQCADFVAAVRVHRPTWVRSNPDIGGFYRLRADWSGGAFWSRARHNRDDELEKLAQRGLWRLEQARVDTRARREEFRASGIREISVREARAMPDPGTPGWKGGPIEPWRVESANVWSDGLFSARRSPYTDWVGPWLRLDHIRSDSRDWTRFWLYDVLPTEMPREWVRWAVGALQGTRKATDGAPGDNSLASYLTDAHVFVTADKALVEILQSIRPYAPVALARPVRIAAGAFSAARLVEDCLGHG